MLSIPLVLLLGFLAYGLVRWGNQKASGVVVGVLFGLALAATPDRAADPVGAEHPVQRDGLGDQFGGRLMTAAADATRSERRMIAHGLRLSVRLADPAEAALTGAAVELVVRARGGEFADAGWPWVVEGGRSEPLGLFRLDPDAMAAWDCGRPAHPVMAFVEALAGGRPVRRLPQLLPVLDRLDSAAGPDRVLHRGAGPAGRGDVRVRW